MYLDMGGPHERTVLTTSTLTLLRDSPLAYAVARAEAQTNAEELERPELLGTTP